MGLGSIYTSFRQRGSIGNVKKSIHTYQSGIKIGNQVFDHDDVSGINNALNPDSEKGSLFYAIDMCGEHPRFLFGRLGAETLHHPSSNVFFMDKEIVSGFDKEMTIYFPGVGIVVRTGYIKCMLESAVESYKSEASKIAAESCESCREGTGGEHPCNDILHGRVLVYAESLDLDSTDVYNSRRGARKLLDRLVQTFSDCKEEDIKRPEELERRISKAIDTYISHL